MSRRLNMYGFSLAHMRKLCGSRDESTLFQLWDRISADHVPAKRRDQVCELVERAIMTGLPFRDLQSETHLHASAAWALARHGQEWLITDASNYHASALEEGLWGHYAKDARPEIRAFLRALIEGVPMFGSQPPNDGSAYAAISLERLRPLPDGLRELADLIAYRDDKAGAQFATAFSGWVDQIVAAGRDLWFMSG